jgi:hypothetical protein
MVQGAITNVVEAEAPSAGTLSNAATGGQRLDQKYTHSSMVVE